MHSLMSVIDYKEAANLPEVENLEPAELLDRTRGLIPYSLEDLPDLDPECRIALWGLTRAYGERFGPLPNAGSGEDALLSVSPEDRRLATPKSIKKGLYIDPADPRYKDALSLVKIKYSPGVRMAEEIGLRLPFRVNYTRRDIHSGVVFPPEEFDTVAHGPSALVAFTRTRTQRAQQSNPDRVDARQAVDRSGGHVMESYIARMDTLEKKYHEDRQLMIMLYRQASGAARYAHYKTKNLDRAMKLGQEMFHETIEIASFNNWSKLAVNGIHRSVTSSLIRRGTSEDVRLAWRRLTTLQGLYINARHFKLIQARALCQSYLSRYQQALDQHAAENSTQTKAA